MDHGTHKRAVRALRRAWREMVSLRPHTPEELHRFVEVVLGLRVPREPLVEGSSAPFDYLTFTFFEGAVGGPSGGGRGEARGSGDCVVWANRGGGKTHLGAAATLLDLLFKPGIQVRILGGSLEQSLRMYTHLCRMIDRPGVRELIAGTPTQRRVALTNGSAVEVLAQSQRSVRGTRVHKLRCDEVDEFDHDVWDAAQLTTASGVCGPVRVRGGIEAISTMHRPYGLMSRLVRREVVRGEVLEARDARVFRWCALDVVERCEMWRSCDGCALWEDCRGVARRGTGFVSVEDLLASKRRVSDTVWESEMMCRRPRTDAAVYPTFSVARHARGLGEVEQSMSGGAVLVAGMDLGLRNPVTIWALVHPRGSMGKEEPRHGHAWALKRCEEPADLRLRLAEETTPRPRAPDASPGILSDAESVIEVIGECLVQSSTLEEHLARAAVLMPGRPVWVGVDPAGRQRNAQTGVSDLEVLRRRGYAVRAKPTSILQGIESVRRRLDRGTLFIHPRCAALIRAMSEYHFDPERPNREEPVKDGPDHACDALRYLIVSYEQGSSAAAIRSYL